MLIGKIFQQSSCSFERVCYTIVLHFLLREVMYYTSVPHCLLRELKLT